MTALPKSLAALIRAIDALEAADEPRFSAPFGTSGERVPKDKPLSIKGFTHLKHLRHPETTHSGQTPPDDDRDTPAERVKAEGGRARGIYSTGVESAEGAERYCFQRENHSAPTPLRVPNGAESRRNPAFLPAGGDPAEAETRAGFLERDGELSRDQAQRLAGAGPETALAAWTEGLDALDTARPHPALADEWPTLVVDARAFLATWGLIAARLGWPSWALWGVHREVPASWRGRELVALLHGRPVVAVTATEAVIRMPDGKTQTYRRPAHDRLHPAERCLLWELAL